MNIKKILNTIIICCEIILIITLIILLLNNILLYSIFIVILIFIIKIFRFFLNHKVCKEDIYLPNNFSICKLKDFFKKSDNYIYKKININTDMYIEKSVNSLEFIFVKKMNNSNLLKNLDNIVNDYLDKINNNKNKFYNIYIIVEYEEDKDNLYENIFNILYIKPAFFNKSGYSNSIGSFIIPIIYETSSNKLLFGNCNSHTLFFTKKKESFISAIEFIIDNIEINRIIKNNPKQDK